MNWFLIYEHYLVNNKSKSKKTVLKLVNLCNTYVTFNKYWLLFANYVILVSNRNMCDKRQTFDSKSAKERVVCVKKFNEIILISNTWGLSRADMSVPRNKSLIPVSD